MINVSAILDSAPTCGRSCSAPNEQLSPIVTGRACRTACQNASTVCPERLRPDRSVSVIDSITGTSRPRSEEHTSELQSLMRISYAVFCLKKKNTTIQKTKTIEYIKTNTTAKN